MAPSVPRVIGNSIEVARAVVHKNQLQVDERVARGTGQPGFVVGQAPPPGTPAARGDTVVLCSVIPAVIPGVLRLRAAVAQRVLADSGYGAVLQDSAVTYAPEIGIVLRQQPVAGTPAALSSIVTLFVGARAPTPTRPMPNLDRATFVQANDSLRALGASLNDQMRVRWQSENSSSYTTVGSIVVRQQPTAGTPVKAGDALFVTLRDTTTPQKSYTMPKLGGGYLAARESLDALRRASGFALEVTTAGAPDVPNQRDRLVVTKQTPAGGTTLRADAPVFLVLRDTTTPPVVTTTGLTPKPVDPLVPNDTPRQKPANNGTTQETSTSQQTPPGQLPPPARIMPDVVHRTVGNARDTLTLLGIPFVATAADNVRSATDSARIDSQSIPAFDTVPAGATVHLYATEPVGPIPWPLIVAVILGVTAVSAGAFNWIRRHYVGRMTVVPHVDPVPPRMHLSIRSGETADEAFGRIGVSFIPVPHRGTATITRVRVESPYNPHHDG